MFYEEKRFPWKIIVITLGCLVVLFGGIYAGITINQKNKEEKARAVQTLNNNKTKKKESVISKDCEIWLEDESIMLGVVPEKITEQSLDEIMAYLEEKYPEQTVKQIKKNEIILANKDGSNSQNRNGKYTLEVSDGVIVVYKYDNSGNKKLYQRTDIPIEELPQSAQEEIKNVIVVDNEDELDKKLEDFGS